MAFVTFESGNLKGRILSLEDRPLILIGRGPHCDVIVDDDSVSRSHLIIENIAGNYLIVDQQSRFGTMLNGERVPSAKLTDDDLISIGATQIVFSTEALSSAETLTTLNEAVASESKRVLVVDDELVTRQLHHALCTQLGWESTMADNGVKALAVMKSDSFDLLLTDRDMPEMNGDDLCVAAKELAPSLPVIMLTTHGKKMIAEGERPENVDLVMSKPADQKRLEQAFRLVQLAAQSK